MRLSATAMALATLAALLGGLWASGCTGLSSDCELNLTCPPPPPPPTVVCSDLYFPGDCDTCLEMSCCQELADCGKDLNCLDFCIFGLWPAAPPCIMAGTTKTRLDALTSCMATKCSPGCNPKDMCNPVTGAGCVPTSGTVCDAVYPGMFACVNYPVPMGALCAACDPNVGPFCGPGLRCDTASHKCARYCCNDNDCGTGKCVLDQTTAFGAPLVVPGQMVGICLAMGGAGPSCDAPMTSPSMGSCITDYP